MAYLGVQKCERVCTLSMDWLDELEFRKNAIPRRKTTAAFPLHPAGLQTFESKHPHIIIKCDASTVDPSHARVPEDAMVSVSYVVVDSSRDESSARLKNDCAVAARRGNFKGAAVGEMLAMLMALEYVYAAGYGGQVFLVSDSEHCVRYCNGVKPTDEYNVPLFEEAQLWRGAVGHTVGFNYAVCWSAREHNKRADSLAYNFGVWLREDARREPPRNVPGNLEDRPSS